MMKSAAFAASLVLTLAAVGVTVNAATGVSDPVASTCSTLNLTPYSQPEALSIRSAKGTTHFKVEIADSFKEREQGAQEALFQNGVEIDVVHGQVLLDP